MRVIHSTLHLILLASETVLATPTSKTIDLPIVDLGYVSVPEEDVGMLAYNSRNFIAHLNTMTPPIHTNSLTSAMLKLPSAI